MPSMIANTIAWKCLSSVLGMGGTTTTKSVQTEDLLSIFIVSKYPKYWLPNGGKPPWALNSEFLDSAALKGRYARSWSFHWAQAWGYQTSALLFIDGICSQPPRVGFPLCSTAWAKPPPTFTFLACQKSSLPYYKEPAPYPAAVVSESGSLICKLPMEKKNQYSFPVLNLWTTMTGTARYSKRCNNNNNDTYILRVSSSYLNELKAHSKRGTSCLMWQT